MDSRFFASAPLSLDFINFPECVPPRFFCGAVAAWPPARPPPDWSPRVVVAACCFDAVVGVLAVSQPSVRLSVGRPDTSSHMLPVVWSRARARLGRSIAPRFLCLCAARRVSGHARLSSTAAPSTPDTYLSRTPGGGGGRRRRRRRRRFTPAITCTMRRPQIARYAEIGPISLVGRRLVSPMGSLPRGRSSEA